MLRKFSLLVSFSLLLIGANIAQETLLINAYNRPSQSLDGAWNYIVDPYENGFFDYRLEPFENSENPGAGAFFLNSKPKDKSDLVEYNFDTSDTLLVPGDWNTQKEKLYYYEGSIWYKKSFDYLPTNANDRIYLYFGAVNYKADVYLNGKKLGQHLGGFTPFNFDVTEIIETRDNYLILKVDNKREKDGVPTLNTDWWNYGGITRSVKIVALPSTFIQDYLIQLDSEDQNRVNISLTLRGENVSDQLVDISIPELGIEQELKTDEDGKLETHFFSRKLSYWTPDNPTLYRINIKTEEDELIDDIGFRTIDTKGQDILLNNEKVFLKGICIHEESPIHDGRANSIEDAAKLLGWAKELGCNYVRLAHYPHNEHMVRMADKMGLLVWEEIPVYWTISWENEATYQNAENQLTEVISRDKNRASVIIWSMANETPNSDARNKFLGRLAAHTRELDPSRLISAALEQSDYKGNPEIKTIDDPFADVVDILSFNQYIGWYVGLPERCSEISWKITQNKPVLISEFGAGAKYGYHGDTIARWTEEYQEYLYRETLKMIDRIPQIRGFTPWILVDFRSPRRPLPKIQDGYNRKGVLSEKGEKKKAFFTLQEYYQNKQFPAKR